MSTYSIGEAKTNLSKLVKQAEAGEEVVLRRGQQPVARLVPIVDQPHRPKRTLGIMRGRGGPIPDDFDEWPEDIARDLCIID